MKLGSIRNIRSIRYLAIAMEKYAKVDVKDF